MNLRRAMRLGALGLSLCALSFAAVLVSPWGQEARRRAALGECPFPHASRASFTQLMQQEASTPGGLAPMAPLAASKMVWGLTLESSSIDDVRAWAAARSLTCHSTRKSARTLECQSEQPVALAAAWTAADALTLVFHFDAQDRLSGVRALGAFPDDDSAKTALTSLTADTRGIAGGEPNEPVPGQGAMLAEGLLSQVRVSWARRDLYADISATRMAKQISVQQHVRVP